MDKWQAKLAGLARSKALLAHSYIIEGSDIQVREAVVLEFCQFLLCSNVNEIQASSCGICQSCSLFNAGTHPDFVKLGAKEQTIGVDEMRSVSSFLEKTSQLSGNQVVCIDYVENMTENAANALLKTLEEPSRGSYLLLLTDNKNQLLPTIRSRCQLLSLIKPSREELLQRFPNVPDYVLGFSKESESQITLWLQSEKITDFEKIYSCFIQWLKVVSPSSVLIDLCLEDEENTRFLVYLIQRRVRQLMIKHQSESIANADLTLTRYVQQSSMIKGQNKGLALTSLLQTLAALIR